MFPLSPPSSGLVSPAPTWHANMPTPAPKGKVRPHAAHSLKQWPIFCAQSHSAPAHPPPAAQWPFIAHQWPGGRTQGPPSMFQLCPLHWLPHHPTKSEGSSLALLGVWVSVSFPGLSSEPQAPPSRAGFHLGISSKLGAVLTPIDLVITLDVVAVLGLETGSERVSDQSGVTQLACVPLTPTLHLN